MEGSSVSVEISPDSHHGRENCHQWAAGDSPERWETPAARGQSPWLANGHPQGIGLWEEPQHIKAIKSIIAGIHPVFGSLVYLFIPFLLLSLPCLHCLPAVHPALSLLAFPVHTCSVYPAPLPCLHCPQQPAASQKNPFQSVPRGAVRTSIPLPNCLQT